MVPNTNNEVGIIGAGLTGLCACKHLMQHGFKPTVMEAGDTLGGIWRHTCSITRLQSSSSRYQFSDFPWPPGTSPHPSHQQVLQYLDSYATQFHIKDRILLNCKVVEVRCSQMEGASLQTALWGANGCAFANVNGNSDSKVWHVRVERRESQLDDKVHDEWLRFDFLVLCMGRYGDPMYPAFPPSRGPDMFSGKVLHAMEYASLDDAAALQMLRGKRVVLVGYMKSAIDITMEATTANQGPQGHPCHLIFRTTNWVSVDRNLFGNFMSLFYLTRFAELMHHKPGQGWLVSTLSICMSPLKWLSSKIIELYLLWHLPLSKYGLLPNYSFSEHASQCKTFMVPDEFFPRVEKGEIILHKTSDWGFCQDGVVLHDGTCIQADIVILGTGYDSHRKIMSLLPTDYSSSLLDPSGVIPLYRGAIHPRIPHLAILGYQLKSSYVLASEMSARWLAYFLAGRFCLPNVSDMEKNAHQWIEHMRRVSPFFRQKVCNASAPIWHCDEMCRDMGWNPWRKKSLFQELFSPYTNLDYKDP